MRRNRYFTEGKRGKILPFCSFSPKLLTCIESAAIPLSGIRNVRLKCNSLISKLLYFIKLSLLCYFITQRPKSIAKYNLRSILLLNPSHFVFCRINLTLFYAKIIFTGNLFRSRLTTPISCGNEYRLT